MPRVARFLTVLLLSMILTPIARAGDIVFLVRIGTDAEGNALFRQADGRDTYLSSLFNLTQSSRAVQAESQYYDAIQRDRLASSLQSQGASAQQVQSAIANFQPEPTFVEVNTSGAGSYNDWNSRFSVQYSNGQTYTYASPRVVFPLNNDVTRSGDSSLIEQTLVHEMGHGAMAMAVGSANVPRTPMLGQQHSGIAVTDPQLAFIEGWAEFTGAYFTGRDTVAQDAGNALDNNLYARNSNGTPKNAGQLNATEGWTASVLLKIARAGANQNAMWKITQVMERTRPQSMMDLLAQVERYNPELAPTINQTLAQESSGQIQAPPGVAPQYAGYANQPPQPPQTAPQPYYGNTGAGQPGYGGGSTTYAPPTYYGSSAATGGNGFDGLYNRLASAMFSPGSAGSYSTYSNYYGGTPPAMGSGSPFPQAAQTTGSPSGGSGSPAPWYEFWKNATVSSDMAKIKAWFAGLFGRGPASTAGPVAAPQYAPQAYRYGPSQMPPEMDMPAAPVGSGPLPDGTPGQVSAQSYKSLLDAMHSSDPATAKAALAAYRQAEERRRALQQQTTPGGQQ